MDLATLACVLIPLSSGLVFRLAPAGLPMKATGLNPFIFRAGVQAYAGHSIKTTSSLNPFIFRAGVQAVAEFGV